MIGDVEHLFTSSPFLVKYKYTQLYILQIGCLVKSFKWSLYIQNTSPVSDMYFTNSSSQSVA